MISRVVSARFSNNSTIKQYLPPQVFDIVSTSCCSYVPFPSLSFSVFSVLLAVVADALFSTSILAVPVVVDITVPVPVVVVAAAVASMDACHCSSLALLVVLAPCFPLSFLFFGTFACCSSRNGNKNVDECWGRALLEHNKF